MAAELPSTQVMSIARPAIRPQTRTKVIEILAGNANGCLQELGYSPGLLERNRYLDDACTKLQTANQQLLTTNQQLTTLSDALKRDNKALRAFLEQLTDKCKTYQEENVKLYEDNTKLVSEVRTHEEMSGQDISVIVGQYALLKNQYADAVKELQLRTTQMVSMAANASASAPQPVASGSNTPREIRPVPVVSIQQQRRVSAPQLQTVPVQSYRPQPHSAGHTQPPPRNIAVRGPVQNVPSSHRQSFGPLPWTAPHGPPLPTPMPTPTANGAPAPGYGPYAGPSSYRRGSVSTSAGHGTPPIPPTPPMSALPLNLQNFASPGQSHPGPARTASASSSSAQQRTPAMGPSPALPSASMFVTVSPPASAPRMPTEMHYGNTGMVLEVMPGPPETPSPAPPEVQMQEDGNGALQEMPMQDGGDAPLEGQDMGSPSEVHEAVTPPLGVPPDVALASDSLKRVSPGVDEDDPRKRARTEEEEEEEQKPVVKMEVDSERGGAEEEDEDEDDEDDEDGNEVGYIEVGPDGLRTVRDCVSAVFDPERNFVCRFCDARYTKDKENGLASEPPPEMAGCTVEEMAAHCESEHDHVWEMLRHNV